MESSYYLVPNTAMRVGYHIHMSFLHTVLEHPRHWTSFLAVQHKVQSIFLAFLNTFYYLAHAPIVLLKGSFKGAKNDVRDALESALFVLLHTFYMFLPPSLEGVLGGIYFNRPRVRQVHKAQVGESSQQAIDHQGVHFLDLPFDVLGEIFKHLTTQDMVSITQTQKKMYHDFPMDIMIRSKVLHEKKELLYRGSLFLERFIPNEERDIKNRLKIWQDDLRGESSVEALSCKENELGCFLIDICWKDPTAIPKIWEEVAASASKEEIKIRRIFVASLSIYEVVRNAIEGERYIREAMHNWGTISTQECVPVIQSLWKRTLPFSREEEHSSDVLRKLMTGYKHYEYRVLMREFIEHYRLRNRFDLFMEHIRTTVREYHLTEKIINIITFLMQSTKFCLMNGYKKEGFDLLIVLEQTLALNQERLEVDIFHQLVLTINFFWALLEIQMRDLRKASKEEEQIKEVSPTYLLAKAVWEARHGDVNVAERLGKMALKGVKNKMCVFGLLKTLIQYKPIDLYNIIMKSEAYRPITANVVRSMSNYLTRPNSMTFWRDLINRVLATDRSRYLQDIVGLFLNMKAIHINGQPSGVIKRGCKMAIKILREEIVKEGTEMNSLQDQQITNEEYKRARLLPQREEAFRNVRVAIDMSRLSHHRATQLFNHCCLRLQS